MSFTTAWIRERPSLAALFLFGLLSVVHTWPLAAAPGRHARVDNGDMQLNAWAMSWVAHQLPRAPLALYDGNIFYPERRALAYSEPSSCRACWQCPSGRWAARPYWPITSCCWPASPSRAGRSASW